jgi:hypothetical protein
MYGNLQAAVVNGGAQMDRIQIAVTHGIIESVGWIDGEGGGRAAGFVGAVGIKGEFVRVDDEPDIGMRHRIRKGRQRNRLGDRGPAALVKNLVQGSFRSQGCVVDRNLFVLGKIPPVLHSQGYSGSVVRDTTFEDSRIAGLPIERCCRYPFNGQILVLCRDKKPIKNLLLANNANAGIVAFIPLRPLFWNEGLPVLMHLVVGRSASFLIAAAIRLRQNRKILAVHIAIVVDISGARISRSEIRRSETGNKRQKIQ